MNAVHAYERALDRLPVEVQEWAAREVTLHVEPYDYNDPTLHAYHLPPGLSGAAGCDNTRHAVILRTPVHAKRSVEYILIHELAHAWLGHRGTVTQEEYDAHEREVEEQIWQWLVADHLTT